MNEIDQKLQQAGLHEYFMSLPPSHQQEYLKWINAAKKPDTKTKRIAKMVELLKAKRLM